MTSCQTSDKHKVHIDVNSNDVRILIKQNSHTPEVTAMWVKRNSKDRIWESSYKDNVLSGFLPLSQPGGHINM